MPRENSFSDEGRSLTPDMDEEIDPYAERAASPHYSTAPTNLHTTRTRESVRSHNLYTTRTRESARYPPTFVSPIDRFRRAVRKVIALHQGTNILVRRTAGAEPGVDVLRNTADAEYGSIKANAVIDVVDYSAVRSNARRMANREFVQLMGDLEASEPEPWVKVRWINIGGVSWDVIKALSIRYDLHPLALEDIFHAHPKARSKVDYYNQHLFMRLVCHELGEDERSPDPLKRSSAPAPVTPQQRRRPVREKSTQALARTALQTVTAPALRSPDQEDPALQALKKQSRVSVNVAPMFVFLLRDGTVITMHPTAKLSMTEPIAARLRQFDSGLRTSADASLLVQSLLSLVADMALEVVNAYQGKIKHYERQILTHPTIETVRDLHILSADLILHRRTLEPIVSVVTGLRRYDVARVAALLDDSVQGENEGDEDNDKEKEVVGYMSQKAQVYLADVNDHMDYVLSQLDVIAGIGQNLVDYTFNLTSYEMNEVMRRLTLASIIFLPLTLLAGYAGMNFNYPSTGEPTNMWFIRNHSDAIFWAIALPVLAVTMLLFLGPDIRRMASFIRKKVLTRRYVKNLLTM
ncbi:magnesium transporter [Mycena amicta]|nr:magnesium transporter [Mycena amicta]